MGNIKFMGDLIKSSYWGLLILIGAFILDIFVDYNYTIGIINNIIRYNLLDYGLNELNDGLIDVAIAIFTVSGIFISITTLIIQHISDKRGTVIMKLFLEDEVFLKFLAVILYLSIILLLSAIMKVFNVYLVLVVIFGILLSVCTFLSYIKKVCEIVNPSESICYVLEKLSKEELSKDNWKNKIIRKIKNLTYMEKLKNLLKKEIKTNNNGNNGTNGKSKDKKKIEKPVEYNSLFRVYKIIKNQLESGDLDTAEKCISSLGGYYEKLFKKYGNNPKNQGYFIDYTFVIRRIINEYTSILNKKESKDPLWHKVYESSIDALYKIAEVKINNNNDIDLELEIIETIYENGMSLNAKNDEIKRFKIIFTDKIIETIGKLFEKYTISLYTSNHDVFKTISFKIIFEYERSKDSCYLWLLEEFLKKIYNPYGEYGTVKRAIRDNSYQFILMNINELKEKIESLDKPSYTHT